MPSTISAIALDANYEPIFASQQALLIDLDAVAQTIGTTLRLFQGEWWESLTDGTPLFQSILGPGRQLAAVAAVIRTRILSVPFVTSISNVSISLNRASRALSYSCSVQTAFGTITVSTGL
jgi:hypothetical protein